MNKQVKLKQNINFKEKEKVNISELVEPYLKKWYYYIVSIIIAFSLVYLYVRFTIPIYKNSASILISEEEGKGSNSGISLLENLEFSQTSSNLMNEIEILKAYSVLEPVVDSLCLNIQVYFVGEKSKLRRSELFVDRPINIQLIGDKNDNLKQVFSSFFQFINGNEFSLSLSNNKVIEARFGDTLTINNNKLLITRSSLYNNEWLGKGLDIEIFPKEKAVEKLRNDLTIEKLNKESSVIKLSIEGVNQDKNNLILDALIKSYQRDGLNDKNIVKTNTSNFIKGRIHFLLEELNEVEKTGENYKTDQGITDFQSDITSFISSKTDLEKNIINTNIQLNLTKILFDFINELSNFEELLPSNLGFEDPTINGLTDQYNKLILERKKLIQLTKLNNPLIEKIDTQLYSIRTSLQKSLNNLKNSYEVRVSSYNNQFNRVNGELSSMPKFEREYRAIIRQQQIKESLYLYLLQKREENEIELAASVSNIKVIVPPIGNGTLVAPKKSILYLVALILSLFIPIGIIYIIQLFDNKLKSAKDLDDLTLLGQIPKSDKANSIIDDTDRSFLSESFRMLRTNINFSLSDKVGCKVIALSSTLPNEGKTFISMNLANSLSKAGSKVIVVGLDLRMPKLLDYVNIKKTEGISNFIIDESLFPKDIINIVSDKNELYLINAGDIPPNPAELLLKPRFKELMNYLKENFDYVILDTSPIGLISDCLPIVKNEADLLLYIARVGYLQKKLLSIPKAFINESIVDKIAIVLNYTDPFDKKYGYGNGYGYGYGGYTNGYFNDSKKNIFQKILNFFFKK
jgi:capsular exopolysaccharide synthesis family protein